MEPRNLFLGMNSASLCSLAGRYDNPIPLRFLAPIDTLKIPAQRFIFSQIYYFSPEGKYGFVLIFPQLIDIFLLNITNLLLNVEG